MHCNNIEMFIYAYNISEEEIIKCKNFIKEKNERNNKINERNNNKEDNLLSKRKNNKSQSPLKNQYYKLKKSFLKQIIFIKFCKFKTIFNEKKFFRFKCK